MEIELKNIFVKDLEVNGIPPFRAHLYIDKINAALVGNDGDGDRTWYVPERADYQKLIAEAEQWCEKSLTEPMNLELHINKMLFEHLKKIDLDRFHKDSIKEMRDGILFGVPDKQFRVMKYQISIEKLISFDKGLERLKADLHGKVLPVLRKGEKILNTNIPFETFMKLGIAPDLIVAQNKKQENKIDTPPQIPGPPDRKRGKSR
jgi:hypothetical protein